MQMQMQVQMQTQEHRHRQDACSNLKYNLKAKLMPSKPYDLEDRLINLRVIPFYLSMSSLMIKQGCI